MSGWIRTYVRKGLFTDGRDDAVRQVMNRYREILPDCGSGAGDIMMTAFAAAGRRGLYPLRTWLESRMVIPKFPHQWTELHG